VLNFRRSVERVKRVGYRSCKIFPTQKGSHERVVCTVTIIQAKNGNRRGNKGGKGCHTGRNNEFNTEVGKKFWEGLRGLRL